LPSHIKDAVSKKPIPSCAPPTPGLGTGKIADVLERVEPEFLTRSPSSAAQIRA
jgi:hypothetical protein